MQGKINSKICMIEKIPNICIIKISEKTAEPRGTQNLTKANSRFFQTRESCGTFKSVRACLKNQAEKIKDTIKPVLSRGYLRSSAIAGNHSNGADLSDKGDRRILLCRGTSRMQEADAETRETSRMQEAGANTRANPAGETGRGKPPRSGRRGYERTGQNESGGVAIYNAESPKHRRKLLLNNTLLKTSVLHSRRGKKEKEYLNGARRWLKAWQIYYSNHIRQFPMSVHLRLLSSCPSGTSNHSVLILLVLLLNKFLKLKELETGNCLVYGG